MTEIQWFAFVILPATIAVAVFLAARLFEILHPLPAADIPEAATIPPPSTLREMDWVTPETPTPEPRTVNLRDPGDVAYTGTGPKRSTFRPRR